MGLLLAQERLCNGGGCDGLFALLLSALERVNEVGEFAPQAFGLTEGDGSGLVREGTGLLGHGGRSNGLLAPLLFGAQRLA